MEQALIFFMYAHIVFLLMKAIFYTYFQIQEVIPPDNI
jgi:hypothetical protein